MKSRIGQETTHVWLVNEAAKQIDLFKAQPQQIKENIEKLIEKNVIKRNEKNRTCYDYIA
jgi:ribosomal protein L19E